MRVHPPEDAPFAYTAVDTPKLRHRIESDLARIVDAVREADPAVVSVLLVGGFSRGEGTVSGGAPVNDYDILAIREGPLPPPGAYDAVARTLAPRIGLDLDLKPVWRARLPFVARTIFWYEAREAGRTVHGADDRSRIRAIDPASLPVDEGLRLLFNRAAGLVEAADPEPDAFQLTLASAKATLACAEALLVAQRAYHWSLRERARRFGALDLPAELGGLASRVRWATRWKLSADATADAEAGSRWEEAKRDVLATLDVLVAPTGVDRRRAARRADAIDRLVYLARARRLGPDGPGGVAREVGLDLLEAAERGRPRPDADLERARRALSGFGPVGPGWRDVRTALLAARTLTVQ